MSDHMREWLCFYLDGELKGRRLQQVKDHLAECNACRAELESLQYLSAALHEVPAPEFTSPERFAARVNLRLPHRQARGSKPNVQEVGWWMIPISLLAVWIFINTSSMVSDVIAAMSGLGFLDNAPGWLVQGPSGGAVWSGALGQLGILSGVDLEWAEATEAFTRNTLPQLVWQASIAMLYLSWIAIWWARHTPRETDQLPEG